MILNAASFEHSCRRDDDARLKVIADCFAGFHVFYIFKIIEFKFVAFISIKFLSLSIYQMMVFTENFRRISSHWTVHEHFYPRQKPFTENPV